MPLPEQAAAGAPQTAHGRGGRHRSARPTGPSLSITSMSRSWPSQEPSSTYSEARFSAIGAESDVQSLHGPSGPDPVSAGSSCRVRSRQADSNTSAPRSTGSIDSPCSRNAAGIRADSRTTERAPEASKAAVSAARRSRSADTAAVFNGPAPWGGGSCL